MAVERSEDDAKRGTLGVLDLLNTGVYKPNKKLLDIYMEAFFPDKKSTVTSCKWKTYFGTSHITIDVELDGQTKRCLKNCSKCSQLIIKERGINTLSEELTYRDSRYSWEHEAGNRFDYHRRYICGKTSQVLGDVGYIYRNFDDMIMISPNIECEVLMAHWNDCQSWDRGNPDVLSKKYKIDTSSRHNISLLNELSVKWNGKDDEPIQYMVKDGEFIPPIKRRKS